MIDYTKPVQTRSGKSVRILCIDGPNKNRPILGAVQDMLAVYSWCETGQYYEGEGSENPFDLVQQRTRTLLRVSMYRLRNGDEHIVARRLEPGLAERSNLPHDWRLLARGTMTLVNGEIE